MFFFYIEISGQNEQSSIDASYQQAFKQDFVKNKGFLGQNS
jgi:hypothetical protein